MIDEELKHYGVIGMRWGVRKNPEKAFNKAKKKSIKLKEKANKAAKKQVKAGTKAAFLKGRASRYITKNPLGKDSKKASSLLDLSDEYARDAEKYLKKYEKYKTKSDKWMKAMEKTFKSIDINDLSEDDVAEGKEYVEYIKALQAESHLKKYR